MDMDKKAAIAAVSSMLTLRLLIGYAFAIM